MQSAEEVNLWVDMREGTFVRYVGVLSLPMYKGSYHAGPFDDPFAEPFTGRRKIINLWLTEIRGAGSGLEAVFQTVGDGRYYGDEVIPCSLLEE